MGITADDYLSQLQSLLPQGQAWPREPDATLTQLMAALAEEFARFDARTQRLFDEADPRTTVELLADWERVAGLPEACLAAIAQTTGERRSALLSKLIGVGGQSRQYFIGIAAALGYTVTLTEFRPFQVNSEVNDALRGEQWRFAWQVNSALITVRASTVAAAVNDPLRSWGNAALECVISKYSPAHTKVLFAYT
ncbi:YmfQ family protein [Nitrosovibrio sp. Nv4]|uniref:YmfQ family protein n=1 Tax=Nitrosovibrio sp. Nv4 TaxID=1945880 RepID=UPI000BD65B10|nr:putative phage tail protein [Nitrosovibrio sp. Nv4]SOD42340.1 Uncharacterized protein YmfQ in lambdoid prophage, DUF2313 family [Nitrosovibrio sp. Nv4]